MVDAKKIPLNIRHHLLWEYDLGKFDFDKSAFVVIERIIERGNMQEWRDMLKYYGKEEVLRVAMQSKQLDKRDKNFTKIYVDSEFNAT